MWQLVRDRADFFPLELCQRLIGAFGDGGEMIRDAWDISENGQDWRHDFTLTYRKVSR
jgi:hypothetical protein